MANEIKAVMGYFFHINSNFFSISVYYNLFGPKASLGEVAAALKSVAIPKYLRCGPDELFVGRAGCLCALLWIRKMIGRAVVEEADVDPVLNAMLAHGREKAGRRPDPGPAPPLVYSYYGTEYLGEESQSLQGTVHASNFRLHGNFICFF
jgi:hypothetical protein